MGSGTTRSTRPRPNYKRVIYSVSGPNRLPVAEDAGAAVGEGHAVGPPVRAPPQAPGRRRGHPAVRPDGDGNPPAPPGRQRLRPSSPHPPDSVSNCVARPGPASKGAGETGG